MKLIIAVVSIGIIVGIFNTIVALIFYFFPTKTGDNNEN